MKLATLFLVEGIAVIVLLAGFFSLTTVIMDGAMHSTESMITGMFTGNMTHLKSSVSETDSYMRGLGKTSVGFLDNIFSSAQQNATNRQSEILASARKRLAILKAEFGDSEEIEEIEQLLAELS